MKNLLIIGAGDEAVLFIKQLQRFKEIRVAGMLVKSPSALVKYQAERLAIPLWKDVTAESLEQVDFVLEISGELADFLDPSLCKAEIISGQSAQMMLAFASSEDTEKTSTYNSQHFRSKTLEYLHEGILCINRQDEIMYMNEAAEMLLGSRKHTVIGKPINTVLPGSRLSETIRKRERYTDEQLKLPNGEEVVYTCAPIEDDQERVTGAFAVLKKTVDIVALAEELTDVREVKSMLAAIIDSSQEAISVVDENGIGLIVNPAYTRLTGYEADQIVGKPAITDIMEGESLHMQVIRTRRPATGARMRVGKSGKEMMVNAAPIIVDGKLRGSVGVLHDISELHELQDEVQRARKIIRSLENKYMLKDVVADSDTMQVTLEQVKFAVLADAPCLLRGDAGVGKGMFAAIIHNESKRRHHPFIRVDCAANDEESLENQLFGSVRQQRAGGLIERSNGGTLFLDDVDFLPIRLQEKLSDFMTTGQVLLPAGKPKQLDVRIVVSARHPLERAVFEKRFHEPLFEKLKRITIYIPDLAARVDDFEGLLSTIIHKQKQLLQTSVQSISKSSIDVLKAKKWSHNVKELETAITQVMTFMEKHERVILPKHIQQKSSDSELSVSNGTLQEQVELLEKQLIEAALQANDYNKKATADQLGVSIRNLYYKMDKYNFDRSGMQDFS
ncbi:sigma 54-interacting transcriptional regulator [Terribacillus sp. DMT04]|uniref:sigma 54-interacting transcriptional regulator n=1 Tax=Terribacillus sp. DMT04 TaxID=2850441 RepID=UPI001C2C88BA|nr:sigma 54-interacting transcriptional regulator [Terribacillus sp. DMT04]QXE00360.1 sigma 54-interacting transcriptional regulator [Terribacillus sp. DMT04]